MHPARPFHETDRGRLEALVASVGLALVVGVSDSRPLCAHAPVLLAAGRLRFHLSAANPLAAALVDGAETLAVVTGPEAYVSPDWYGLPDQVPTWNYLSAEIAGPVRRLDAHEATRLLDDLSAAFEARLAPKPPWTRAKMSPGRFEAMLAGIIAFEMEATRLEGVRKLAQNKSAPARLGVAEALEAAGNSIMAGLMRVAAEESH